MNNGLMVCVGTGGVGKTTIAAAVALGAAMRGRRVAVLTIDPAHQLARSLGLDALAPGGEPVSPKALAEAGIELSGSLDAGMLDQKRAWDDLITRLMPNPTMRQRVLDNPFYQQLSTSFPGSNELMAIEEVCRLAESGRYELVVLDTPPASHALEFLRAPERIDRLLDRSVFDWLARPYQAAGRGAWRSVGAVAQMIARRLERAAGQSTLRDISTFLVALHDHLDALVQRNRQARQLLYSPGSAFVLVARPRQLVVAETDDLMSALHELHSPLAAVVPNRVHRPPPANMRDAVSALLDDRDDDETTRWLRWAWEDAVAEAEHERRTLTRLASLLPPGVELSEVPEDDRDVHSMEQLARIADALWLSGGASAAVASAYAPRAPARRALGLLG
jgi:anion-transporting  ArsA/GET3 family ATPase